MVSATLSSKFQLAIPTATRGDLGIFAGQKFALIAKGQVIEHNLSFADAIIYDAARQAGARLVTSDKYFSNLTEVVYFQK